MSVSRALSGAAVASLVAWLAVTIWHTIALYSGVYCVSPATSLICGFERRACLASPLSCPPMLTLDVWLHEIALYAAGALLLFGNVALAARATRPVRILEGWMLSFTLFFVIFVVHSWYRAYVPVAPWIEVREQLAHAAGWAIVCLTSWVWASRLLTAVARPERREKP